MREFSDQTLTLSAVAPYLNNPTEICGVEHIRKQECDRISAIVHNLIAMGVRIGRSVRKINRKIIFITSAFF